jgi:hypothetical protein
MTKTFMGIAAAALLTAAAGSAPANAAPIRSAPGLAQTQSGVDLVQHRRGRGGYARGYRGGYGPRAYGPRVYAPHVYGPGPYAYVEPYPYRPYRRYYAPAPHVQVGPFGFGIW